MADNAGSKGGLNPIAQQYIVACTILPLLAVISVGLRLATKTIKGTRMGGDDYTIIACLVIAMILSIIGLHAAAMEYVGKPFDTLNAEELKTRARVMFSENVLGHILFGLVKISIIQFYKKIFDVPRFKMIANVLFGIIGAWMILSFALGFPVFKKLEFFWSLIPLMFVLPKERILDKISNSQSGPKVNAYIGSNLIIDVILDVVILVMPMPMIKKLNLPTKQKIPIIGIFLLGAFCTIASGIRLRYTAIIMRTVPTDRAWGESVDLNLLWAHVEVATSIIAACLPTLGPLFRSEHPFRQIIQSTRAAIIRLRYRGDNGSDSESTRDLRSGSAGGYSRNSREDADVERMDIVVEKTITQERV